MTKIVLFYPKLEAYKDYHYFPLSLLSVVAPLIKQGITCRIIDERVNESYEQELMNEMQDAFCFCTTAFTGFQLFRAFEMSQKIKKAFPEIPVIWGGQHIINLPYQTLNSKFIDIGIIGYGDFIFEKLINQLLDNQKIDDLPGVGYKNNNGEVRINPSPKIDTDNLSPLPYWLIDIKKYVNPNTERLLYVSSYGCPGVCTFCSTENQRNWVLLPLKRLKSDLSYLFKQYPFKEIVFFDATAFALPERLLEIAAFIKPYDVKWIINSRAREMHNADDNLIKKLIEAGLKQITASLETGSDSVVLIMKKGKGHLKRYEELMRKLSKFNILLTSGLIFGIPGETIDDLKETIAFIRKIKKINKNFRINASFFRPLPGTELYYDLMKKGFSFPQSLEEWAEKSDETHFKYNQWMDIPWMDNNEKNEYRKIYEDFMKEEKDIFI